MNLVTKTTKVTKIILFSFILLPLFKTHAQETLPKTILTWHGHAAFQIETASGTQLLIDPWLNNPEHPAVKVKKDPISALKKIDYLLITHGHFDHVGDAVAIAKKTQAKLVATFELGQNLARLLGFPSNQMGFDTLMNIGGEIALTPTHEITVAMVPAIHSSGLDYGAHKPIAYGGAPVGFIIKIKNGPTFYHTGDTAYFKEMENIAEQYKPDVALINIGGHFGMEPPQAAQAAKDVDAQIIIPHHFKTFPVLSQNTERFRRALGSRASRMREIKPGEKLTFSGKELLTQPSGNSEIE